MHIQYFGLSSFKLTTKDAVVITDPLGKLSGLTPPRGNADILILAEKNNPLYSGVSGFSGSPFVASDPGEYDVKGVTITGIPLKQDETYITVFLIESEDIKILNLSHIKDFNLKQEDLEALGDIDILILPVGGNSVLDAATAAKVGNQIEPAMIIPSHYQIPGLDTPADKLEKFIKEMGVKMEEMDKIIVKKKDLDPENTKVVVLSPMRGEKTTIPGVNRDLNTIPKIPNQIRYELT